MTKATDFYSRGYKSKELLTSKHVLGAASWFPVRPAPAKGVFIENNHIP
jgi:hypothetical protein